MIIVLLVMFAFTVMMMVKNSVTFKHHIRIVEAVGAYQKDVEMRHDFSKSMFPAYEVDWSDMESYSKTMFRLWDWGYKRILPPDKFEIIKHYI